MAKKDKKAKAADKKQRIAIKQERKAKQKDKKAASKSKSAGKADPDSDSDQDIDAVLAAYALQQEQYVRVTETVLPPSQAQAHSQPQPPPSSSSTNQPTSVQCATATPPPRTSATILASPATVGSSAAEIFLFGGESFNGGLASFYNDLYIYNTRRDEWRLVTSPNSPLPRSGHAWCRAGNENNTIYLFGGEFSSPKQGTFYHYRDFWSLDVRTREWSKIEESRGGGKKKTGSGGGSIREIAPSSRSGHRMTYFKNYILLFGGFQDTAQQTKYLADLWMYDCNTYAWHSPVLPPASPKPEARSSFTFLPHEGGAVLFGGYSRVKTSTAPSSSSSSSSNANQNKSGKKKTSSTSSSTSRTALKPLIHTDSWFLRIRPPTAQDAAGTLPRVHWERRKRPANQPNPARAGATMAFHKGRGIQFGGVHDVEESEEGIESEFFNSLFVWNVDRNRFFPLSLKRPRQRQGPGKGREAAAAAALAERSRRGGRAKADEADLLRNLASLEARGDGDGDSKSKSNSIKSIMRTTDEPMPMEGIEYTAQDESDEEGGGKVEKPVWFEMPHARFNAQVSVHKDVAYIFGGTYEKGEREYTFDDMYAVDLGRLDGVKVIYYNEPRDWHAREEDDEEDDEEEDEGDDESEDDEGEESEDEDKEEEDENEDGEKDEIPEEDTGAMDIETATITSPTTSSTTIDTSTSTTSTSPHPRPFESLRAFYARTLPQWQDIVLQDLRRATNNHNLDANNNNNNTTNSTSGNSSSEFKSIKEARKLAFDRAEARWWDVREEMGALEEEQDEAGIGEVVELAEKGGAGSSTMTGGGGAEGGGVGRRR